MQRIRQGQWLCGWPGHPEQKAQIEQTLTSHPEVRQVFPESQEQAYERFQEQFQDSIAETITPDQLQESFRVELRNPERYEGVVSAVVGLPGVHQVIDQREVLEPFFDVLNSLQVAAAVISAIMIVAAVLLIANTIRLAAFSRRRETGIMRLVGASNFYIQLPFILEAAIAGSSALCSQPSASSWSSGCSSTERWPRRCGSSPGSIGQTRSECFPGCWSRASD